MAARVIALEEHLTTPDIEDAVLSLDAENVDDITAAFRGGEIHRRLLGDDDTRIADMDASGIDVQVLSLTSPGVQSLEPGLAVRLAGSVNETIAERVRAHPDRYQGFATLPTPDPTAAAKELERAVKDLGLVGAMIHGRTREQNLDDAVFEPVWETAASLGVPVYIHPQIPQRAVRGAYYTGFEQQLDILMACPYPGWHYETGMQVLRMILAGVFDRNPDLKIVLGHWGEMMLFYLDRLDQLPVLAHIDQESVSKYFRENVWVTPSGIYSQRYLRWAIEILGVDRIMSAMDYPYVFTPDAQKSFLPDSGLSQADQDKISGGNWEKMIARPS